MDIKKLNDFYFYRLFEKEVIIIIIVIISIMEKQMGYNVYIYTYIFEDLRPAAIVSVYRCGERLRILLLVYIIQYV